LNEALRNIKDLKTLKQVVWDGFLIPRHTALHPKQERLPSDTARAAIEKIWQAYNEELGWKLFISEVQAELEAQTGITFHHNTIRPHVENFIRPKTVAEALRRGLMDGRNAALKQLMNLKGFDDRPLTDVQMKELNSMLEATTLQEFAQLVEDRKQQEFARLVEDKKKKHGSL
jgi:hypothetical protein